MRRKSLSTLGAATAWIVGFLSISCGARGFVLLMFYQVRKRRGSRELLFVWFTDEEFMKKNSIHGYIFFLQPQIGTMATKYRKDLKVTKDGDAQKSSVRGPSQVLACSAIAVMCSLAHALYLGEEQPIGKYRI